MQETAAGREGRWVVLVVKDFSFRQQNDDDRRFKIMIATIGINLKGEACCPDYDLQVNCDSLFEWPFGLRVDLRVLFSYFARGFWPLLFSMTSYTATLFPSQIH